MHKTVLNSLPVPSQDIVHLAIQISCLEVAGAHGRREILGKVNWGAVSKLNPTGEIRTTLESYRLLYL